MCIVCTAAYLETMVRSVMVHLIVLRACFMTDRLFCVSNGVSTNYNVIGRLREFWRCGPWGLHMGVFSSLSYCFNS